jgi:hypothetical protein
MGAAVLNLNVEPTSLLTFRRRVRGKKREKGEEERIFIFWSFPPISPV